MIWTETFEEASEARPVHSDGWQSFESRIGSREEVRAAQNPERESVVSVFFLGLLNDRLAGDFRNAIAHVEVHAVPFDRLMLVNGFSRGSGDVRVEVGNV